MVKALPWIERGNAYITGYTDATDLPTKNPVQAGNGGSFDAFVTKINATGDTLIYSTYIGGSRIDLGNSIVVVDRSENAYITGRTDSTDFPTQNPVQAVYGGSSDAFVTKLSAPGNVLVYSTYFGGSKSGHR